MPDVPDYAAGIRHKEDVYAANQVAAVFIYPGDLSVPGWPQKIADRIMKRCKESPGLDYHDTSNHVRMSTDGP